MKNRFLPQGNVSFKVILAFAIAMCGWRADLRAQTAPRRAPLDNFDKRLAGPDAKQQVNADQSAAANQLKLSVPGVRVDFDPIVGSPSYIASTTSFLSEQNGVGKGISSKAASAIAADDPHKAVKAFLNDHAALFGHGAEALNDAIIKREYSTEYNGSHTVVWEQQLDGLSVFERVLIANTSKKGELVNISSQFLPSLGQTANASVPNHAALAAAPTLSAAQALASAAPSLGETVDASKVKNVDGLVGSDKYQRFVSGGGLKGESYARLVWLPMSKNSLRLAWEIIATSRGRGEMFRLLVDAQTGETLIRRNLTEYISPATYNVYTNDSPGPMTPSLSIPATNQAPIVSRTLLTLSALNTNASPLGWISDTGNDTQGNNVDAHTDLNDDDVADLPRPQGNPNRVFNFTLDLTQSPLTYTNASVVQLFYLNNFMHDKLYELGFTEAAGNFQTTNFNRGGFEGDAVQADDLDGALLNDGFHQDNANFATPPDGIAPRMQMYMFVDSNPNRDGALDAEVVCHEYTHGLSNRRVGGGVGISDLQPSGMGEGWSDFYALSLLSEPTDDPNATYANGGYITYQLGGLTQNYYFGIRRYPYSTDMTKNPLTFKDIDPTQASSHPGVPLSPIFPFVAADASEVHNQGEVWCMTLWEARAKLIVKYGWSVGNKLMLQLVTDGMSLSPANPTFLQARDAIIQADALDTGGANFTDLWTAFAKRGMGASAVAPASTTTTGVIEAFDLPGISVASTSVSDSARGNGNGIIDVNECVDLSISLINQGLTTATNPLVVLTTTTPGVVLTLPSTSYTNIPPGAVVSNSIPFRLSTSPNFICGTPIVLQLIISTTTDVRTNTIQLATGSAISPVRFDSNVLVAIPDNNSAGVDSLINVSGIGSAISKVTVSMYITHTFDSDLQISLVAPDGTTVPLSFNNGSSGDNYGQSCSPDVFRTTFDDSATTPIASGSAPFVGSFIPDSPLSAFNGKSGSAVNGVWKLHIADVAAIDVGTLHCWSLSVSGSTCTTGPGACPASNFADLLVLQSLSPSQFFNGFNTTYTLTVVNQGPGVATNVVLTNILPANANFVSATPSQGSVTNTNGVVIANLGTILDNSSATISVVVVPVNATAITNAVSVGADQQDPNPFNNSSTLVSTLSSLVGVSIGDITVNDGPPGTNYVSFIVSLSQASAQQVTVSYSTGNRTAIAGRDYVGVSGNLVFPPGVTSQSITVGIIGSNVNKPDRTFVVNLFNPINAVVANATAIGTILNDDPQPGISIDSPSVVEGNSGTTNMIFTVSLTSASGQLVAVNYGTSIGTASVGVDYGAVSGTLFFPPGITTQTISVPVYGDTVYEPDEVFYVNLFSPLNATNLVSQGVGTILNDDPIPTLTISDVTLAEGNSGTTNAVFNVSLSGLAGVTVTVDYATADGTATVADSDYTAVSGTLTFPPGVTNRTIAVPVIGDIKIEPNETFTVNLSNPMNAAITKAQGLGTIVNDDGPTLSINDVTVIEGNSGTTNAVFTVTLSQATNVTVTVKYTTQDGTATAPSDYSSDSNTLTFNPGETNKTITISVNGDTTPEPTETFTVLLHDPTNATISRDTGTGTIKDDDTLADLQLIVSIPNGLIFRGHQLDYTINVTNIGPYDATNVVITNIMPANSTFVSAVPTQGSVTNSGNLVVCSLGVIPANTSAKLTLSVIPNFTTAITNITTVQSDQPDPNLADNAVSLMTTVVDPVITLVNAGTALTAESVAPANGAIDPSETVTVILLLQNNGNVSTTNLVATLLPSGGVLSPSGPQTYGAVANGSGPVGRAFTFTAPQTNNGTIVATLALQDVNAFGSNNLGNVTFTFQTASTQSYANTGGITIPEFGSATPYPSTITVSGQSGVVNQISVTLSNFSHTFPQDVRVLLVGPAGQKMVLMANAGGPNAVAGANVTFDDNASSAIPENGQIATGTYQPATYGTVGDFNSPAPAGPYDAQLSAFKGTDPNGVWSLYVLDSAHGDSGSIAGGWSLSLKSIVPVNATAGLYLTVTASPTVVFVGSNLTYTVTITNRGPAAATSVTFSNTLGDGVSVVSATPSQGSVLSTDNPVLISLGTIGSGATASITLAVTPNNVGIVTNLAAVIANESDLQPANRLATTITHVNRITSLAVFTTPPTNNQFGLTLTGQGGITYVIQASTDLINWTPISTNTTFDGTINFTDPSSTGQKYRFYRAVER